MKPITLDNRQKEAFEVCKALAGSIGPNTLMAKIKNLFIPAKKIRGIYMHGGVGRGKTMLMQMFYKEVSVPKEIIHYQAFMRDLHQKLHKLQISSQDKVIESLAADIAIRVQVICMDEFEIKDITDAMIIMRLFRYLATYNVFIFLTTNTRPENLYLDGLQRESFLPFIKMIQNDFEVVHLDTEKDYRFELSSSIKEMILYPDDSISSSKLEKIKSELLGGASLSPKNIPVFGRSISFKRAYHNILFTDFEELFERDMSYNDYVAICDSFQIIVLDSVRQIGGDEENTITRFINFIDNVYFYKILLFAKFDVAPDKIYLEGKRIGEFARTISRLNEMNSGEYLK